MEFTKWAPSVRTIIMKGGKMERQAQYARFRAIDFQVCLVTYEYIIKERNILARIKWICMIIDEGHRMKNVKSKLSQTLNEYYSTRYRLILTGTPLQVSHQTFGSSRTRLMNRTISQNCGLCSISSCRRSSTRSNRSTSGSMLRSPIPVERRWK